MHDISCSHGDVFRRYPSDVEAACTTRMYTYIHAYIQHRTGGIWYPPGGGCAGDGAPACRPAVPVLRRAPLAIPVTSVRYRWLPPCEDVRRFSASSDDFQSLPMLFSGLRVWPVWYGGELRSTNTGVQPPTPTDRASLGRWSCDDRRPPSADRRPPTADADRRPPRDARGQGRRDGVRPVSVTYSPRSVVRGFRLHRELCMYQRNKR